METATVGKVTVQGRDCNTEVAEGSPALIGLVPLQLLDFVVDPENRRLIGNPNHGGVDMWDMLRGRKGVGCGD
jgi:hypothetical protein